MERIPTGIKKLDDALEGGIPKGAWVVISGEPGTGKTVLTQMLAETAIKRGYKVAILSTEMTLDEWKEQANSLGINVDTIVRLLPSAGRIDADGVFADMRNLRAKAKELRNESDGWVSYLSEPVLINITRDMLEKIAGIGRYGPLTNTVLVIDSVSMFYLKAPNTAAKVVLDLMSNFKSKNLTVVMTTQYAFTTGGTFGARAEHVADGVIHMWMDNVERVKEVRRYLIIKKMRATNHALRAFRVFIEPGKGMRLEELT